MRGAFVVLTGTGIRRDTREWAPSATEAMRLVLNHMKVRRPGVRVEDEDRNPVSFFELKEKAEAEARKRNTAARSHPERPAIESRRVMSAAVPNFWRRP